MDNATRPTLWTAGFFNERFPHTISPLAWSLLGPLIEELALRDPLRYLGYPAAENITLTRLYHGHPYSNAFAFQVFYKLFPDFILPEDSYRYFPNGDARIRRNAPYPPSIVSPRLLIAFARAFVADWRNFSPFHNHAEWARYTGEHDRRVAALRARLPTLAHTAPAEVLAALAEAERAHRDLLRIHRWSLTHADLTFGLLKRLARAWIDREHGGEAAARLAAGAPNKTLQVDAALRDLAVRLRPLLDAQPAASGVELLQAADADTRAAFDAFLTEHGHRSFSLDIAYPTFRDDPEQVLVLLRAIGVDTRLPAAVSVFKVRGTPLHRWLFERVRSLAVKYVALREDQRYYWQKSLAISRALYLILAGRLVAERVVSSREDVFYASHAELVAYFQGRLSQEQIAAAIDARRTECQAYAREQAYPAFLLGDVPLAASDAPLATGGIPAGGPAALAADASQQSWQARAISPGTARGTARVVQSAGDLGRVQAGDILVAPATDPAWTPVFGRIAGLVLERGGVLSHGAVVAREYHVPAVAGIANIASVIHDGDVLEVDGNRGVVSRL